MLKPFNRSIGYVQPAWEAPSATQKVTVVYGQSRADNHAEGTAWCVYPRTTNSRVLMMNNPRAPGRAFQGPFDPVTATTLITGEDCRYGSLADPGGHTLSSRDPLGQSLLPCLWYLDAQDVALGRPLRRRGLIVAGEGAQKIAVLSKGAAPFAGTNGTFVIYDRMIAMVTRYKALALAIYGQAIEIESILWAQGEADSTTATQASYYASFAQLVTDMTTDLMALTGQASAPYFLFDQVASGTTGAGNPASLAQLQYARANPTGKAFMIGPASSMPVNGRDPTGATYHFIATAKQAWGEQNGRVRDTITQGGTPDLCYVSGYSLVGSTLTLNVHVPVGSLTTDSDIPAITNKGFKLRDTGGATISSVTVGSNTITIALSQAPASGASIEYAYENPDGTGVVGATWAAHTDLQGSAASTAGSWGNIRDGRADVSSYGYTLRNFLTTFQQVIA